MSLPGWFAAIAGGIAEALHGLPQDIAQLGSPFLTPEIEQVMRALYAEVPGSR